MNEKWNNGVHVSEVRVARPTDQLDEIIKFYRDALGLEIIGSFEKHEGYTGVMFGLPGRDYHLEFTQYEDGSPCPAPTKDNLMIFYIPSKEELEDRKAKIESLGYSSVKPENPYWKDKGVTFEDPDGWRVVLMNTSGI